mmetsp:Transcript_9803/g.19975  ORF Transcript_9803/g.19975 Transcript_9803/m.19975 type:complete len:403 (+) Transcript_9803:308-1516(+)
MARSRWGNTDRLPGFAFPPPSSPDPGGGGHVKVCRRTVVQVLLGAACPWLTFNQNNLDAHAVTVAPLPINPYSRKRRRAKLKHLVEQAEIRIEQTNLPLADEEKSFFVSATAGFLAATLSTALSHPIDTAKARIQMGQPPIVLGDPTAGLSLLYRGVGPNIAKEAPNAGIYLGVYEAFKGLLLSWLPGIQYYPILLYMVAGAAGDAVGSLIRVPAEIVSKRLQLGLSLNWREATQEAFFTPAGRAFSRRIWTAVLLRDVPYGALQIAIYEQLKTLLMTSEASTPTGALSNALAGGLAGMISAFLTTPPDLLVTKLSAENASVPLGGSRAAGVFGTWKRIVQEGGYSGLWKGSLQRSLYYLPLCGVFFALYEVFRFLISHPSNILDYLACIEGLVWRKIGGAS